MDISTQYTKGPTEWFQLEGLLYVPSVLQWKIIKALHELQQSLNSLANKILDNRIILDYLLATE